MATTDMWTYRETAWSGTNLEGFDVEASDGGIGKVDEATNEVGGSYIVVDTGPWIFGKKVLLPAGVIETVDFDEREGLRQSHEGRDQGQPRVRREPLPRADLPGERR